MERISQQAAVTESRHYLRICLQRLSNRRTTSVKIAGGMVEIRPRHLPNSNLELTAVKAYSVLLADFDGIWYYMGFMLSCRDKFILSIQCYRFFRESYTYIDDYRCFKRFIVGNLGVVIKIEVLCLP